jgi:argininosuccinate lyase
MGVLTIITVLYSGRVVGLTFAALSEAISPIIFAAFLMAGCVYLARGMLPAMPDLAQLALLVPLGVAIYLGVLLAIAPHRLAEALRFARNREAPEAEPANSAA